MTAPIKLPRRSRGRQSSKAEAAYQDALHQFCEAILQINSSLDFQVASRSWCYLLEEYGLLKGDFDDAQKVLVQCRKDGLLPLDIVAEDSAREFNNLESINASSIIAPGREGSQLGGAESPRPADFGRPAGLGTAAK